MIVNTQATNMRFAYCTYTWSLIFPKLACLTLEAALYWTKFRWSLLQYHIIEIITMALLGLKLNLFTDWHRDLCSVQKFLPGRRCVQTAAIFPCTVLVKIFLCLRTDHIGDAIVFSWQFCSICASQNFVTCFHTFFPWQSCFQSCKKYFLSSK